MTRNRSTPVVLVAALLAPALASAGALEHCTRLAPSRVEVTPCLQAGKKAMTDAMLEQGGKVAALKQSQRDFERYLHSHCQVVLRAYDSGTGAAQAQLACEVDLLQQRAELLKPLAPEQPKAKE
ncbi:MAG: hypothetical protein H6R03_683 [Burkholderiaceae bacterium]|nr:hypothetical protein [Burkholderiaceae bacterium]